MFPEIPFVVDFGLLKLEVDRRCMVLKRKDREYPHVTFFYEKMNGRSYWWPHITYGPRGRREELAKLRASDGRAADRRMGNLAYRQMQRLLRPVSDEEIKDGVWSVIVPDACFLIFFLRHALHGKNVFVLPKLFDFLEDEHAADEMGELLDKHLVCASEITQPGSYAAIRVSGDEVHQDGVLYAFGKPKLSWFAGPTNLIDMGSDRLLDEIAPGLIDKVKRCAEVLDVPLPGLQPGGLILPS